jgi:hypothetical protein
MKGDKLLWKDDPYSQEIEGEKLKSLINVMTKYDHKNLIIKYDDQGLFLYEKSLEILAVIDHPTHAPLWPDNKVVVIYNKLNGTKNVFVFTQDLELVACPKVWEGNDKVIEFVQEALSP